MSFKKKKLKWLKWKKEYKLFAKVAVTKEEREGSVETRQEFTERERTND